MNPTHQKNKVQLHIVSPEKPIHKVRLLSAVILLVITCVISIAFYQEKNGTVSGTGVYFDTVISITLYGTKQDKAITECMSLAKHYENLFSKTIEGSDIYRINHSHGDSVSVDPETITLLQAALSYCDISDGKIDITTGGLLDLWDFSAKAGQTDISPDKLPTAQDIHTQLSCVDYHNILIDQDASCVTLTNPNATIDLGFIAKGYIADQMKIHLQNYALTGAIINLGGNILTYGSKTDGTPFRSGIQKPFAPSGETICSLELGDQSLVTTGTYCRYFYDNAGVLYHHILDSTSGYPLNNDLCSVTILSDSSLVADALSTTCFVLGVQDGLSLIESLPDTEALFLTIDGTLYKSNGFPDAKFSN